MDQPSSKPARRVRYKGTHPKAFQEKYKELQPDKYAADVEKVKQKGATPAGMHRSICVDEILDFLQIKPGQKGLDATLGYGGHSLEMLRQLSPDGILYAIDADPIELPKTRERLATLGFGEEKVVIQKMNFCDIHLIVQQAGQLDFVLADLGVSSMQIDNPERGFTFKADGPLDLRLNPRSGKPASALLKKLSQKELQTILVENADEPYAEILSVAITARLAKGLPVETTGQLRDIIRDTLVVVPKDERPETIKKSSQRCFQALRIAVNQEFEVLEKFLEKLPDALVSGGRVAILSFHSGEDRRVKKFFQHYYREGIFSEISLEPIRPSAKEIFDNPRARSTKMRWAVKA